MTGGGRGEPLGDLVVRVATDAVERLLRFAVDRPGAAALALLAWTLLWLAGGVTVYFLNTPTTAPRLLTARGPRRWFRVGRAVVLRIGASLAAWPHVLMRGAQRRTPRPPSCAYEVVATYEGAALRRYGRTTPPTLPPVLLVHAVVTTPAILDLAPGRSLVADLLDRGHDVFMLVWEEPGVPGRVRDVAHMVEVLASADRAAAALTRQQVHLIGYCSGGLITILRLSSLPASWVASCALIATPVDLTAGGGILAIMRHPELRPAWALDGDGNVPAAVVREAFHMQHRVALRAALHRRRLEGEEAAAFDALDRWLYHQRDLEGGVFFDLIDLARENPMVREVLVDGRRVVDPGRVTQPCLVVLADRDHLVPPGSSLAATHVLEDATLLDVPAGHVGMLASGRSSGLLYGPLSEWIRTGALPD